MVICVGDAHSYGKPSGGYANDKDRMSSSVFEGMLDQPTGQRSTKHADYTQKQGAGSGSGGDASGGGDTRYGKPSGGHSSDGDRMSSSVFEGMLDQPTATASVNKSTYTGTRTRTSSEGDARCACFAAASFTPRRVLPLLSRTPIIP